MYYLFIINYLMYNNNYFLPEQIMSYLLDNSFWAFMPQTPHLKKLKKSDKVIVYMAGKENKCFVASFEISTKVFYQKKKKNEPEWLEMFPYRIKICNIEKWRDYIPITRVINDLTFIKNKDYYGLYLRQSIKDIKKVDFYTITTITEKKLM